MAAGLPIEGEDAQAIVAGLLARRDVPICSPADELAEVQRRLAGGRWPLAVVVNARRVVLGAVAAQPLGADPRTAVGMVMDPAPATARPSASPEELLEYMGESDQLLVTTSDGELIGLVAREDAESSLDEDRAAWTSATPARVPAEREAA